MIFDHLSSRHNVRIRSTILAATLVLGTAACGDSGPARFIGLDSPPARSPEPLPNVSIDPGIVPSDTDVSLTLSAPTLAPQTNEVITRNIKIQRQLGIVGCDTNGFEEGILDEPDIIAQIVRFQRNRGLVDDGDAGPKTERELDIMEPAGNTACGEVEAPEPNVESTEQTFDIETETPDPPVETLPSPDKPDEQTEAHVEDHGEPSTPAEVPDTPEPQETGTPEQLMPNNEELGDQQSDQKNGKGNGRGDENKKSKD